ncbi:hypothetical protein HZH66_006050 [Vespula vulgaris]|uniref:Uncharacterized protein n=1 Tax=Vespula vulgaris TaxID=7454 RepID=A0A834K689_VESVU|nr:hypothetical protein HZH66_006050 [Vespula vulgaris]
MRKRRKEERREGGREEREKRNKQNGDPFAMKSTGMISDSFPNENVRRFPLAAGNGTPEVKFRLVSPVPGVD